MYHILLFIIIICVAIFFALKYEHIEYFENTSEDNVKQIHVYVINLENNKERYDIFLETYNKHMSDIPLNHFLAVDGGKLTYEQLGKLTTPEALEGLKSIDSLNKRMKSEYLTRGMVGCYMSHISLYQYALKNNQEIVLVFEDDANFHMNLVKFIYDLKEFPTDWDILLLGDVGIFEYKPYSASWMQVISFWGLQGYIINKRGMQKIVDHAYPLQQQIDHMMTSMAQNDMLNIYSYKDMLVTQNAKYSQVQMQVEEETN